MGSQVFYRKWRPQTLAEVVGQEHVTRTLLNALASGHISHAYLFCGPRGTGKTSTGRILAKAVNCLTNGRGEPCNTCRLCVGITGGQALDVIEIDAASNRGIDDIRDLREKVTYAPNEARYKVYIIDEVHMLTREASNALLKTLEEPPPHAIFILATTEAHKVIPTILSRCQRFDFRRLSQADVIGRLTYICQEEGISIEPEGLRLIARSTTGSLRDAENMLQQLTTYYGFKIDLAQVQAILGITGDWRARELVKHIINSDTGAGMKTISSVNSDGLDLRQFNREVVEYLRGLLLVKSNAAEAVDFTSEDMAEIKELAAKASLNQILRAVKLFGQLDFALDNYSTLPMELALVDCVLAENRGESPAPQTVRETPGPAKATTSPQAPPVAKQTVKAETVTPAVVPPTKEPAKTATPAAATTIEPAKTATPAAATTMPPAAEQVVRHEPVRVAEPPFPPQPVATKPKQVPVASTSAEPVPEAGTESERLKRDWKKVIEEAPAEFKKTRAIALLRSVKTVAIEKDTVTLSFKYPIHKETIEKTENLKITEKIVSQYIGRPCRICCIHEPEANHLVEAATKLGAQITSVEGK